MSTITTKDGVEIFYKDWGKGQPIVFSHGWPLSADDWDTQMLFFIDKGFRVIAHDRRGHGRSTQVGDGHDLDHYADDLKAVTDHLNLKDPIHVGHSTGGGEVVRYLARHGDKNVAKAAIISAVPSEIVGDLAATGGMADVNGVLQIEMRRQRRQVIGIVIHVVAAAHLSGPAMASAVMSYDAIVVLEEEQHLRVPVIGREWPAVAEHDGLTFAPILIIDVDVSSVFFSGSYVWHRNVSSLLVVLMLPAAFYLR